jgi:hypothetical protein
MQDEESVSGRAFVTILSTARDHAFLNAHAHAHCMHHVRTWFVTISHMTMEKE